MSQEKSNLLAPLTLNLTLISEAFFGLRFVQRYPRNMVQRIPKLLKLMAFDLDSVAMKNR